MGEWRIVPFRFGISNKFSPIRKAAGLFKAFSSSLLVRRVASLWRAVCPHLIPEQVSRCDRFLYSTKATLRKTIFDTCKRIPRCTVCIKCYTMIAAPKIIIPICDRPDLRHPCWTVTFSPSHVCRDHIRVLCTGLPKNYYSASFSFKWFQMVSLVSAISIAIRCRRANDGLSNYARIIRGSSIEQ